MVKRTNKSKKKLVLISISSLVLVMAAGSFLFFNRHRTAVSGTIPSTTPSSAETPTDSSSKSDTPAADAATAANAASGTKATSSAGSSGSVADSSSASAAALLAPSGAFVSNHHPNLGGSPAPSTEQSVCNTTPGASCYIKFTNKDGVVKTLAAQTTDGSGATYWNWDVNKSGFTKGTWTITAVASLNGQTQSTNDSLTLEIQP